MEICVQETMEEVPKAGSDLEPVPNSERQEEEGK